MRIVRMTDLSRKHNPELIEIVLYNYFLNNSDWQEPGTFLNEAADCSDEIEVIRERIEECMRRSLIATREG